MASSKDAKAKAAAASSKIGEIKGKIAQQQSKKETYKTKKNNASSNSTKVKYSDLITQINQTINDLQSQLNAAQKEYDYWNNQFITMQQQEAANDSKKAGSNNSSNSYNNNSGTTGENSPISATTMKNPFENLNGGNPSALQINNALSNEKSDLMKSIFHPMNIFTESETDLFHERYRYGVMNAYQGLTNSREYLFFTKPDLNIIPSGDNSTSIKSVSGTKLSEKNDLNGVLRNYPFWTELCARYPGVIECLNSSLHLNGNSDPFNHLLENMVQSNLDLPGLSAEMTETPTNMYGVGYTYRGSSEASDDGFDFSLEFKDTKYLPVYNFFKAYEEYETLKHHGVIAPWIGYIESKILHDQYAIFKFVVGDDGETIIYYAKYYGVKSKSLPRDVFNTNTYENGLSYSVDFNAAFVEDMNPLILTDFNRLSYNYYIKRKYNLDVYDFRYDQADNRPAKSAIVVRETDGQSGFDIVGYGHKSEYISTASARQHKKQPGGYCYKLKWKGDKEI